MNEQSSPFTITATIIVDGVDSRFETEQVERITSLLNSGTMHAVIDQVWTHGRLVIQDIPVTYPIPAFATLLTTAQVIHDEFPGLLFDIKFRLCGREEQP